MTFIRMTFSWLTCLKLQGFFPKENCKNAVIIIMVIISQRCTSRNKRLSLIIKQWHKLPRKVVEYPLLVIVKTRPTSELVTWSRQSLEVSPNLSYSVIQLENNSCGNYTTASSEFTHSLVNAL